MRTTTVVIGAGHAGLAMSRCLSERSIEHVVLERGEIANSWKKERWDSLRLLTPNWQSRLPGYEYGGNDPDGYRDMNETVRFIEDYAAMVSAPVQTHTTVRTLRTDGSTYQVVTDRGTWDAESVVIASGACNIASVPAVAEHVPAGIAQITPKTYKNPEQLAEGRVLVVGASASGIQIADELHRSGRPVTLSVGEHVRVPRVYRGRDIKWWMDRIGVLDEHYSEYDDAERVRNLPSLQLAGSDERRTLDLNALTDIGVDLIGRFAGVQNGKGQFSGSLPNQTALADLKMNRLLNRIDEWVEVNDHASEVDPAHRFAETRVDAAPPLGLDLGDGSISTIVWATGYRPDHSWVDLPVFDRKGRMRHDGGIVDAPGVYLMGAPFLRRRKSSLIDGAGDDARDLSRHLEAYLRGEQRLSA